MFSDKIAWLFPFPLNGSGGHLTIFKTIQYLSDYYDCHIYLECHDGYGNSILDIQQAQNLFKTYFYQETKARIHLGFDINEDYDIIFATAWYTAKIVADVNQDCVKAYFVQDYEASFNPMGDTFIRAENSYRYGLIPVTIGRWLAYKLKENFKINSYWYNFGADTNIYKKLSNSVKEKAICFIYQPEKPRRCSNLGIESLQIVKELIPDLKIYLYGSDVSAFVPFDHRNLGIISINKCNEIYNRCFVGLCISSTNPSRIPFEMMAAGLPVIDIYGENNLFDMPSETVVLAQPTPDSIAYAILDVIKSPDKRQAMSDSGLEYMKDKSIDAIMKDFRKIVDLLLSNKKADDSPINKKYNLPAVIAPNEFTNTIKNNPSRLLIEELQKKQAEIQRLQFMIEAIYTSKFWKLRQKWFMIKRFLKLTNEKEM
jgi:O-antigen biosynthesis protein